MNPVLARIATVVLSVVIGSVYGTAATVAHAFALGWFPLGLVISVIGSGALLVALRLLTHERGNALAAGAGIILAAVVFSQMGPGGSAIVAAQSADTEWIPIAWTVAVPLLVVLVAAWPDLPARVPAAPTSQASG